MQAWQPLKLPHKVFVVFLQKTSCVIAFFLLLDSASRNKCQSSLSFFSSFLLLNREMIQQHKENML